MKINILFLIALFTLSSAFEGKPFKEDIRNLSKIRSMPYGPELSGDVYFWNAVKCKLEIVPYLIELIENEQEIHVPVNYFGGKYTKGDVAYHVIIEIIRDIPTLDLLKDWKGFDETKGFGNYWSFVRESSGNRKSFKNKIKKWYEEKSEKLIWKVDSKLYQREDKEGAPRYPHPSGGYYILMDKNE